MTIIKVQDLKKVYKTYKRKSGFANAISSLFRRDYVITQAVKSISFSITQGEMIGFVGQNGAGKSTTIKALTGVLYPTSGTAHVLGYVPWQQRRHYVQHIGAVFGQKSQLWWDLPPIDAFVLNKDIYRINKKEFDERLHTMTTLLNVTEFMHRPTRNLSLGQRMKCEVIMALLHNPKVLFLDEPTIGLDAIAKQDIRTFLKKINKKYKTTVILTTHDMDDIEELCQRIIMIDEGSIIYDGDLKIVKEKYVLWKTVDIDFTKITNKRMFSSVLNKGHVVIDKPTMKSIRFHRKKVSVPTMVAKLMQSCDVIDLSVHEPRLENVIAEIYKEQ